jgi:hypothetical protein
MSDTTAIPELETPRKPLSELKRRAPEPEIPHKPDSEADLFDKEDQADSGPDKENPLTHPDVIAGQADPEDAHIGAREDQVSKTQAPAGDAYEDEPKQG